ncbi:glycosyltransferase family 2 protein [Hymenobacter sp. BT523]|uniref:glycosyltransferase n=1 Tax=Hymenobacter sp. BT523 TaxID=2795725 RepID=UPI0018ED7BB7|nr:glycosyltransferase [Hymenobacter sp. BT523]MBJ6111062.1 glycosyltransferase family 2 protein [Hymenobacter sp. BT523]
MPENKLGVSFLLCTYNGAPRLAETLACLAAQENPAGIAWEVIFVDNASTDGSARLAREAWEALGAPAPLRQLHEPRPGYKVAMQRAIDHVSYRYACIVDDDNRLDRNYLRTGVELLEAHPQIGILGGPNTATFDGEAPAWFPDFQHCYASGPQLDRVGGAFAPLADGPVGRNVLWGAGMLVRAEIWQRLRTGGFASLFTGRQGEANLTAGEDDELCYAAQLLSYEVWYSSRLHLRHHMAPGRLTEDYRDRLFYASARATPRLNAYRNALWGRPDGSVPANLLKDLGYAAWGVCKNVCQPAFVRAWLANNRLPLMNQRHALVVMREMLWHYGQVRAYYERVRGFQQRLRSPKASLTA